ncbi:hypothetical protein ACS0TY_005964 [Phlomoides rotata]
MGGGNQHTVDKENDGWRPPTGGRVNLNMDASVQKGFGASIEMVLRDHAGIILCCFAKWCGGAFEVDVVEALAIERGLELAAEQSMGVLEVESDSQTVINALIRSGISLSYLGRIIRNIEDNAKFFGDITFSWTRWSVNCVAQNLALFAFSCESPFFSLHGPCTIDDAVEVDLRAF